MDETNVDWHTGFGTLPTDGAVELERRATASRNRMSGGLASRQQDAIDETAGITGDGDDEDPA